MSFAIAAYELSARAGKRRDWKQVRRLRRISCSDMEFRLRVIASPLRADEALAIFAKRRVWRQTNAPVVVKADGLAAGKGVVVATSRALKRSRLWMNWPTLGSAAQRILIEEALVGREVSVLLFSDGKRLSLDASRARSQARRRERHRTEHRRHGLDH